MDRSSAGDDVRERKSEIVTSAYPSRRCVYARSQRSSEKACVPSGASRRLTNPSALREGLRVHRRREKTQSSFGDGKRRSPFPDSGEGRHTDD